MIELIQDEFGIGRFNILVSKSIII